MFSDYRILFLLLIPIILTIIFLSRNNGRWGESRDFNWMEAIGSTLLFFVVTAGMWYWGRDNRISNYPEQIGGVVTAHYSQDGSHEESYECGCYTDSDGNRHCNTCYRTVYHRNFVVENNTGTWWDEWQWSDRVDKSCESCEPYHIPQFFAETWVGKPVSLDHGYTNYIAPISEDLYRNTYAGLKASLPDICPDSPDIRQSSTSVYKALPIGFRQDSPIRSDVYSWNFYPSQSVDYNNVPMYMDTIFGALGPTVQGDVHLYVMNTPNVQYADMCLAKWKMGAKNSIYVFIFGVSDQIIYHPTDVYVAVAIDGAKKNSSLTFSNESERSNYYMKFDIRNHLLDYFKNGGQLDRESILRIVYNDVSTKFVRQEMADFKALKNHVYPTNEWIVFMAMVLAIGDTILHFNLSNNDF